MRTIHHWIGGKAVAGTSADSGPVFNPATGQQSATIDFAGAEDVDRAVQQGKTAFESWRNVPLTERQNIMFKMRGLIDANREDLARDITAEHGKTREDALGEVQRGLEVVEFVCNIAHLMKGEHSEQVSKGVDTYTLRQPLGVVAGITPFNFPIMVPLWMHPVAIATGNTFILKPSERDPSVSLRIASLYKEAGLPDGVFNIVHGDKVAVDAILTHPDINAVSFVGSTPIAKHIYETGTAHSKRVQALGGAKNHMIVLPDADMELAADAAVSAGFGSAGQRCMAISVLVTVGDAAEKLLPKVLERMATLVVGPGDAEGSEMGPLITAAARERVASYVEQGADQGAHLLADGRGLQVEGHKDGFFFGPTLFDHVTPAMSIYTDEIFGPVLSTVRTDSYAAAIDLINRNPYGNGTAVFTNDGGAARKFQNEIQVGMVGINVPIPVPLAFYSFGGWKHSAFGTHAIYGPEGIGFYTHQKVVISRWPDPVHRGVDLGFPQNR